MLTRSSQNHKVVIALSGGVDSAVAAALLVAEGREVRGVHLRLCSGAPPGEHVAAVARHLGIPFSEVDLSRDFARQVQEYFVSEYVQGRTPNPCVQCNAAIKFGRLWQEARNTGASYLATGHYVRLRRVADGAWELFRGADRSKDQSYFLSRLPRELLPHLLFPLGEMTKKEVRRRYRELGFPQEGCSRESQEICFIPEGRYWEFLRQRLGSLGPPGEMVDTRGRLLGRHRGLEHYTVGQRRGLGIPSGEPYYVVELRPETNQVVLGRRAELLSSGLLASQVNWLMDPPPADLEAQAVIRYRHPGVMAQITRLSSSRVKVTFASPQAAVAPGQAVAFYREDQLLGGAWIEERIK